MSGSHNLGSYWCRLGPSWDHFGVVLGSFCGRLGVVLGSSRDDFGAILGSLRGHVGVTYGAFAQRDRFLKSDGKPPRLLPDEEENPR